MVQVKVKKFSRSKTEIQPEIQPEVLPVNEENEEIKENEEDVNEVPIFNELDDLTNINFNKKKNIEAEEILKKVINKKKEAPIESNPAEGLLTKIINRRKEQLQKVQTNINSSNDDDDATPILGKDRRILTSKIQQYKNLFPEILGKFKLKKNPTIEDLQEALDEMDVMVNCSSVEDFLNDSILQCLKMIEGASSYTRYDVSGMSDLLRQNKQFHQLSKMLYIKYKVFSNIPPEYQMVMLMATTAYVCVEKNKRKASLEEYLNTAIPNPPE
jgi:hypothetical protein